VRKGCGALQGLHMTLRAGAAEHGGMLPSSVHCQDVHVNLTGCKNPRCLMAAPSAHMLDSQGWLVAGRLCKHTSRALDIIPKSIATPAIIAHT
jgi:hypothetical protein